MAWLEATELVVGLAGAGVKASTAGTTSQKNNDRKMIIRRVLI
jgi:hypothetical protein